MHHHDLRRHRKTSSTLIILHLDLLLVLLMIIPVSSFSSRFTQTLLSRRSRPIRKINSSTLLLSSSSSSSDSDTMVKRSLPPSSSSSSHPMIVVISGPTATGKSDVAAKICRQQGVGDNRGIIVSADSVQAYRGVQIGANKPSRIERQQTPHLLIDIIDHTVPNYNAAEWREDALYCIQSLVTGREGVGGGVSNTHNDTIAADIATKTTNDEITTPAAVSTRRKDIEDSIKQARIKTGYTTTAATTTAATTTANNNNNNTSMSVPVPLPVFPVVCGGTMMYLQWLVHGRPDAMRPTPTAITHAQQIIQGYQDNTNNNNNKDQKDTKNGSSDTIINDDDDDDDDASSSGSGSGSDGDYDGAVQYIVTRFGPESVFAERIQNQITNGDWYRLRRTLEIALTVEEQEQEKPQIETGRKTKETTTTNDEGLVSSLFSGERQGSLESLGPYDVRCFFLCPDDRMKHTRIVDERCEQMLLKGLLEETTELSIAGTLPQMAERAIGYRQTLDYFTKNNTNNQNTATNNANDDDDNDDGSRTEEEEKAAFDTYLNDFATATRRYAKKQMSWFRKDKEFMFIPISLDKNKTDRIDAATTNINRLCTLSRTEYETELYGGSDHDNASNDTDGQFSSFKTKQRNQEQGKKMKLYTPERHLLIPGSKVYDDVLNKAIECRRRFRRHQYTSQFVVTSNVNNDNTDTNNYKKRTREGDNNKRDS